MDATTATRLAQRLLQEADASLIVDGKWGNFTNSIYLKAPPGVRTVVDQMLTGNGYTAKSLYGYRVVDKTSGSGVTVEQMRAALERHLRSIGISDDVAISVLTDPELLKIESGRLPDGSLDVTATNGSTTASGPFQYLIGTWNGYAARVPGAKTYQSKQQYQAATKAKEPGSPGDWQIAAKVHAESLADIYREFRRKGIKLTVKTVYTAHNQGLAKAVAYLTGQIGYSQLTAMNQQSPAARSLISTALA